MSTLVIQNYQIRTNTIIEYNSYIFTHIRTRARQYEFTKNLQRQQTYTGRLCPGSRKRLMKSLDLLLQSASWQIVYNQITQKYQPFRLSFITLDISQSLPVMHDDAYPLVMAPFLKWMRDKFAADETQLSYLWKAERQRRGQLHYHITCNKWIHKDEIHQKWNELQQRAGYLNEFFAKYKRWNAPSTHIKGVKHSNRIGCYMAKDVEKFMRREDAFIKSEFGKNVQNQKTVGGKVWDCSLNLRGAQFYTVVGDYEYDTKIDQLIKQGLVTVKELEACNIYSFEGESAKLFLKPHHRKEYDREMRNIVTRVNVAERKEAPPDIVSAAIPFKITPQMSVFSLN